MTKSQCQMVDALRAGIYSVLQCDLPQDFFNVSGRVHSMFVSFLNFWFSAFGFRHWIPVHETES